MTSLEHPIPDGVAAPVAPYSPVVVSGDHVFASGQVGFDAKRRLSTAASRRRRGRRWTTYAARCRRRAATSSTSSR
jgi:enamine deaminase RidA (YjgF/YER057c/UK114 family)